jgi:NAD(P)-dependent dehydrogenase (short-subunit alcohol dehydrogenase family)
MLAMSTSKRIILITGANKGIGLETARQLATAGHTVLLAARDPRRPRRRSRKLAARGPARSSRSRSTSPTPRRSSGPSPRSP